MTHIRNLKLSARSLRWLILVIITIVGVSFAYHDQNALPLLAALFVALFLSAPQMKQASPKHGVFLIRFGLFVSLAMFSVGAFNYLVNPFGLYPPRFFEPIILTSRNHKMELYAAYDSPPKALVIGSSRSFTVSPAQIEQLWGYTTFNASVTGGTMQDYLAFLRYTSKKGDFPQLLIINLAPEILQSTDNRYQNEPDARLWDYADSPDPLYSLKTSFDRVTRLLSKEQTESSFQLLQVETSGKPIFRYYTFDANGMGHFHATNLRAEDLTPDKLAFNFWTQRFKHFDPNDYRFDQLLEILNVAKQRHILVIGYMPPYYPALHDFLMTRDGFAPTMSYLTSQLDALEKTYPFYYMNFIDANLFSKDDSLFYDLVHPTEQASAVMMQQLYDQFHDALN